MMLLLEISYLATVLSLWIAIVITILNQFGSYRHDYKYIDKSVKDIINQEFSDKITIIVPAHNEDKVIITTCRKIVNLNYPKELLQLIVVNDASDDSSAELLAEFKDNYPNFDIMIINTTKENGGRGKGHALNLALEHAKHENICIFDADAAPEKNSVKLLMHKLNEDEDNYACVGRNKCRNRDFNLLTKFINLELIVSQKVVNKGNYELFELGKIPGTNYIIKKSVLDEFDGFESAALTEDTDLSFRMHLNKLKIAYEPRAEAYQQEPQVLKVFVRQRARWAQGNLQVVHRYFKNIFTRSSKQFRAAYLLQISTHYWFIIAVFLSDIFFITQIVIWIHNLLFENQWSYFTSLNDNQINTLIFSWALLFLYYVLNINYALSTEKGQYNTNNFLLSIASYFTYAQLFLIVSLRAFYQIILNKFKKKDNKWYKTERY